MIGIVRTPETALCGWTTRQRDPHRAFRKPTLTQQADYSRFDFRILVRNVQTEKLRACAQSLEMPSKP